MRVSRFGAQISGEIYAIFPDFRNSCGDVKFTSVHGPQVGAAVYGQAVDSDRVRRNKPGTVGVCALGHIGSPAGIDRLYSLLKHYEGQKGEDENDDG